MRTKRMLKFKLIRDNHGKVTRIETPLIGSDLLNTPKLNKGTAFSPEEREIFKLLGKLPNRIESLEEQVSRAYHQYREKQTNLGKNVYLNSLHDNNETLFYNLVGENLTEMLPIVYTLTVGEAVEKYSLELRRSRGLFIDFNDQDRIEAMLENRLNEAVDVILVTDGEGVLGIGDQGIGGMDIAIAKLMVYILCAGIDPMRTLPIQLDVGTNNEKLLKDPFYLGWRHQRISGKPYDVFIDKFVSAVRKKLPNAYLHWEDFGRDNARKNLNRYRNKMATFNDDMQGTGATALACILAGVKAADTQLSDHRIAVLGAGTAGAGIADQIHDAMVQSGLSDEAARKRFWLVDRQGLLMTSMKDLEDFQKPYARDPVEIGQWSLANKDNIALYDVVKNAKPTIIIGCSTVHGAFNESIVKTMAQNTPHPLIFPLSNPTSKSEATPDDVYRWSDGKALVAAGSPFAPIQWKGKTIPITQANNAYVFPGLGLGVIASKAKRVTDGMLRVAADTLSDHAPAMQDKSAPLLPDLNHIREISKVMALAVMKQARKEGVAGIADNVDLEQQIKRIFWETRYYPYRKLV